MTMSQNPPGTKAGRLFGEVSVAEAVWAEHLPQFASRLVCPVVSYRVLPEWHQHDIARAVAHGYEKRPEVLDSWTGQYISDFARHVMENFGVPIFSYVFGLDPDVEERLLFRDAEDIAGVARLTILGVKPDHIPRVMSGYAVSSKYDSSNAPPLDMKQSLRRLMMFERYQHLMDYIDFFGLEDEEVLEAFTVLSSKLTGNRVLAVMGPMMLHAQKEGLNLGECLRVWAATCASSERVLEFVRSGIPVDYARLLTEGD